MSTRLEYLEWLLLGKLLLHRQEDGRVVRLEGDHLSLFGFYYHYKDLTDDALRAAKSCIARGYLVPVSDPQYPDYVFTEAGEQLARGPKPEYTPPVPTLNERDLQVLRLLDDTWQTPQWMGAWNGSYHSASLKKLCANGLAETDRRGYPLMPTLLKKCKGSNRYRLTAKGRARLSAHPKSNGRKREPVVVK